MRVSKMKRVSLMSLMLALILFSTGSMAVILDTTVMSDWERMNQGLLDFNSPFRLSCPIERSHIQGTATNVGASCRGDNDNFQKSFTVNNPADYILSSNVFEHRNIKYSRGDDYCKHLTNNSKWNDVNSSNKASIQDLVNYQCSVDSFTCSSNLEGPMKEQYEKDRALVTDTEAKKLFPEADEFFDNHLNNAKFYDLNGEVVKIPRELLLAVIHEESKGNVADVDSYDFGEGLFNITRASKKVVVDSNGVVQRLVTGNEHYKRSEQLPTKKRKLNDKDSLYAPLNNLVKFTSVFQGKYNYFSQVFNGANGSLDFSALPDKEKFKFILSSMQFGNVNVTNSYKRMKSFNQAMNCNSCDAFVRNGNSCGSIKKTCSAPPSNKCGRTVPESFDVLIRFSNFWEHKSNPDYQKHLSCTNDKVWTGELSQTTVGPCNLALTKAKTYRIIAGYQCAI